MEKRVLLRHTSQAAGCPNNDGRWQEVHLQVRGVVWTPLNALTPEKPWPSPRTTPITPSGLPCCSLRAVMGARPLRWASVTCSSPILARETLALFLVAACATLGLLFARRFSTGVQDRVIRLEERLRMERLLPEELRSRIEELTTDQLIGLRFASDAELEGLVRRVLGRRTDRPAVHQAGHRELARRSTSVSESAPAQRLGDPRRRPRSPGQGGSGHGWFRTYASRRSTLHPPRSRADCPPRL